MNLNFPIFPERASTIAGGIDALYLFLVGLTIFFVVLVSALVAVFAIKYRRRRDDEVPKPIEGNRLLEVVWTVIPLFIVIVIFGWGAKLYLQLARSPEDATPIYVVGKQWMWKIQHPDGRSEINELHVPLGQPIRLVMTSEDVIHSFYVPAFRTKMDVVPGRYSSTWFQPTKVGSYHLFCAEYCGTSHSAMVGRVIVMEQADFDAWLRGADPVASAAGGGGSMAENGAKLFESLACNTCHENAATARGPSLDNLYGHKVLLENGQTVVADESYLRESILDPRTKLVRGFQPIMPTYESQVTELQVMQLIEYIKSLKGEEAAEAEE